MQKTRSLQIEKNNPFSEAIIHFRDSLFEVKSTSKGVGHRGTETLLVEKTEVSKIMHSKLYKHKFVLDGLSAEACKVLMHIAVRLEWNQQKIKLQYSDIPQERRKSAVALKELVFNRILALEKKNWYWVNVTVLLTGTIDKHTDYE